MLRIYTKEEIPQGSKKWHEVRNGLITGTDAYDLLQGKSIASILKHKNSTVFSGNYWTRRGHILEDEGREIYSEIYRPVKAVGFVVNSKYPQCGFSPDGLIDLDGLWEHKAFKEEKHLKVYESLDVHVLAQVQFGLLITERKYCDLTLYNPDIKDIEKVFLVRRIYPDPDIQARFIKLLKSS